MRRVAMGAIFAGGAALVVRTVAPRVAHRLMGWCGHMVEQAPEDFPPKRMLKGVEGIRADSARILELLEEWGAATGANEGRVRVAEPAGDRMQGSEAMEM